MIKIIATAAIYLLTMLLAYVLKKMGLFHKEDKRVLSNLIFYVTLPASLISGFSGAQVNIFRSCVTCARAGPSSRMPIW